MYGAFWVHEVCSDSFAFMVSIGGAVNLPHQFACGSGTNQMVEGFLVREIIRIVQLNTGFFGITGFFHLRREKEKTTKFGFLMNRGPSILSRAGCFAARCDGLAAGCSVGAPQIRDKTAVRSSGSILILSASCCYCVYRCHILGVGRRRAIASLEI